MNYTVGLAREILTRIRQGETLKQICDTEHMPDKLTVYDWIRNFKLKIGNETFGTAYEKALDDRAISWEDEALDMQNSFTVHGDRYDALRLKKLESKSALLYRMAKERQNQKTKTHSIGSDINVIIHKFASPKE